MKFYTVEYRLIGTYSVLKKLHLFIEEQINKNRVAHERDLLKFLDRYNHYPEGFLDDVNGDILSSSIDKWQTLRWVAMEHDDKFIDLFSDRYPDLRIIYYKEGDVCETNDFTGKYFPAKYVVMGQGYFNDKESLEEFLDNNDNVNVKEIKYVDD